MARSVKLGNFAEAVDKLMDEYKKDIGNAIENGLDESQDLLVEQLKAASPKKTGDYAAHWKKGEKFALYRSVVNDKTVQMSRKTYQHVAHDKHLAGLLEYSKYHNHPHIRSTQKRVRRKIYNILRNHIKQGD